MEVPQVFLWVAFSIGWALVVALGVLLYFQGKRSQNKDMDRAVEAQEVSRAQQRQHSETLEAHKMEKEELQRTHRGALADLQRQLAEEKTKWSEEKTKWHTEKAKEIEHRDALLKAWGSHHHNSQKPLVKLFCVMRDEYDLLDDFMTYYDALVGAENMIIIDNNSRLDSVLATYRAWQQKGMTLLTASSYKGNGQGEAFTNAMLQYVDRAQWLIPVDADMFLTLRKKDGSFSVQREDLEDFLRNQIPAEVSSLSMIDEIISQVDIDSPGFNRELGRYVRPARDCTSFQDRRAPNEKQIYRAWTFLWTANGNHSGGVRGPGLIRVRDHPLVYFHYHRVGMSRELERSALVCDGYKYVDLSKPYALQYIDAQNRRNECVGAHRLRHYRLYLARLLCFTITGGLEHMVELDKAKSLEEIATILQCGTDELLAINVPTSAPSEDYQRLVWQHVPLQSKPLEINVVAQKLLTC